VAVNAVTGQIYVSNPDDGIGRVIDGQGTQGVPIGITAQASATVPSPYTSSAATSPDRPLLLAGRLLSARDRTDRLLPR
jgi:hypothetical protein